MHTDTARADIRAAGSSPAAARAAAARDAIAAKLAKRQDLTDDELTDIHAGDVFLDNYRMIRRTEEDGLEVHSMFFNAGAHTYGIDYLHHPVTNESRPYGQPYCVSRPCEGL